MFFREFQIKKKLWPEWQFSSCKKPYRVGKIVIHKSSTIRHFCYAATPDPSEISQPSDIVGVKPSKQIHSPYVTKIKPTIAMADQSTIKPLILETASDTVRVQFIGTGNSLFFSWWSEIWSSESLWSLDPDPSIHNTGTVHWMWIHKTKWIWIECESDS